MSDSAGRSQAASPGDAQAAAAPEAEPERVLNRSFGMISLAQFFGYSNNVMLAPIFPLYFTSIGLGASFVGISMAFFSITSFTTRPFIGRAVDEWSPRKVNILGELGLAAAAFGYLIAFIPTFLFSRMVHGLGWAAINTAGSTIVSQVTPESRRGEAFGYFHMARNLTHMLMPAFAVWLWFAGGATPVFLLSGVLALAAAAAITLIREVPPQPKAAQSKGGFGLGLIEQRALLPSLLHVLVNGGHPIATAYVALVARDRGIEGLPIFFIVIGAMAVLSNFFAHLSDRWGRAPLIAGSFALAAVGMAIMMGAEGLLVLTAGGVIYSAGHALSSTTLVALTVDRAPPGRRGAALATYTAAFQVGSGMSGLLWGLVIDFPGYGGRFYDGMFVGAILMLLIGLAVTIANWNACGARPAESTSAAH